MCDSNQDRERPASWAATLAGMALFLILELELILSEIPHDWAVPSWLRSLGPVLFLSCFVFPVVLLGIGWVKGFPRWSYPYVGFVLLVSGYMMHVATSGLRIFNYTFGRKDLWGWRAWIPFFVMAAIALLITRSLRPLLKLFANISEDWTLLAVFHDWPDALDVWDGHGLHAQRAPVAASGGPVDWRCIGDCDHNSRSSGLSVGTRVSERQTGGD